MSDWQLGRVTFANMHMHICSNCPGFGRMGCCQTNLNQPSPFNQPVLHNYPLGVPSPIYQQMAAPLPWLCPKCQRVYGPTAKECEPCNARLSGKEMAPEDRIQANQLDKITDDTPLCDLELSARTKNALRHSGIYTAGQIRSMGGLEILRLPNFGRKSLNELRDFFPNLKT